MSNIKATRTRIINKLGSKCVDCGFSDIRALEIDHIKAVGGAANRGTVGSAYYSRMLKDTTNLQVLCANCHTIKTKENKEHRHGKAIVPVDIDVPPLKPGVKAGDVRGSYKWKAVGPDGKRVQPGRKISVKRLSPNEPKTRGVKPGTKRGPYNIKPVSEAAQRKKSARISVGKGGPVTVDFVPYTPEELARRDARMAAYRLRHPVVKRTIKSRSA